MARTAATTKTRRTSNSPGIRATLVTLVCVRGAGIYAVSGVGWCADDEGVAVDGELAAENEWIRYSSSWSRIAPKKLGES